MRYPEETVQEVTALNDIVNVVQSYVQLSPRSGNHFGLCPFHNEKSPSFSVNQSKQIFYCFGCNVGGSVITFVMKIENLDFVGALKLLADRVNYKLPEKEETHQAKEQRAARELATELNKKAARFFYDHLYSEAQDAINARTYLQERGVSPALAKRFGLGLSPNAWDGLMDNLAEYSPAQLASAGLATQNRNDATRYYDRFRSRLMFPIIDQRNRVVGFGGRIMASQDGEKQGQSALARAFRGDQLPRQEAKYVNTPETALFHKSDNLYGLNLARKSRKTELIIVEGYMDVLTMHQAGFTNTVGVLGTALNDSHCRLLKNAGCTAVVLMLDGDEAGLRATLRAIAPLTKAGIKIKVLNISNHGTAKDPDEYLQKNSTRALQELIHAAPSHIAFQVSLFEDKHDMDSVDGRVAFTQEAAALLATLPSAIETEAYTAEVAKTSGISQSAIAMEVAKQKGILPSANVGNNAPIMRPRRRIQQENIGVKKAREALLHLLFTNPKAASALQNSGYINEAQIGGGIYAELLRLAYKNATDGKQMSASDIIAHFEGELDHGAITEIYIDSAQYESRQATEKALNETAFIIKRAWALNEMENAKNDQQTLQNLGFMVRNIPALSI